MKNVTTESKSIIRNQIEIQKQKNKTEIKKSIYGFNNNRDKWKIQNEATEEKRADIY